MYLMHTISNCSPIAFSAPAAHEGIRYVQGVDDARNVTQNCQTDVDEQVGIAASLEEDTEGWEDDGEDDLADVTV